MSAILFQSQCVNPIWSATKVIRTMWNTDTYLFSWPDKNEEIEICYAYMRQNGSCFSWHIYVVLGYDKLKCFSAEKVFKMYKEYLDGFVQDCDNSIANTLKLPQSCTGS